MTKDEVIYVIKRYTFLCKPIKAGLSEATFYIGNRKHVVKITDEVIIVCKNIEKVYASERDNWMRQMMKGLLSGDSDINIMQKLPFSRNSYYAKKTAFFGKVYECCIASGLVSFNEILYEDIA